MLFANLNKYANSISGSNKVVLINPVNIGAIFNRAKLRHTVNDFKGAIVDYDKVTSLFPYVREAYYLRAEAKTKLKDFVGAKKDMETGKVMSEVFHAQNKMQYNRDSLLMNKLTRLSADFHNTSDIKPDNVNSNFLPIFYLTEKDSTNYNSRNFNLLIEDFNWKHNQNLCLKNIGAFDTDTSLIFSVLKNRKLKKEPAQLLKAIYNSNIQNYHDAGIVFDSLALNDSVNVLTYFARGVNFCKEVEFEGAQNNDAYIISDANHDSINLAKKMKCNLAIRDFNVVLKLYPDFYFALYNRAYLKCLLGDYYGANFDYEQAIKLNPKFADAYFNNGFLLYYLNMKQAACENFSKAGELGLSQAFSLIKKHCSCVLN